MHAISPSADKQNIHEGQGDGRPDAITRNSDLTRICYASIQSWMKISGMSRSGTYKALGRKDLRAKKIGTTTLIDVQQGLTWLSGLPEATFRTPR